MLTFTYGFSYIAHQRLEGRNLTDKRKLDFCTTCRKETEYTLKKKHEVRTVANKKYTFVFTTAICNDCNEDMNLLELIDKNIQEFDEQYRAYENIVSVADIKSS